MKNVKYKISFVTLGVLFWAGAALLALLPSWPHLYYRLFPSVSNSLASTLASTVSPNTIVPSVIPGTDPESIKINPNFIPDLDPSLPKENGVIIDKIDVQGQIHEGTDWENILKLGVWRVPDFGTPENNTLPIILAAHRWGYLSWSAAFRKLNSFYNLPKLAIGDTIKIVWNQRPYEYKVYSVGTGTKITEYKANLILYTCQMWNSPVRFFVYANRVN
jgi:hypothetical protein